MFHIATRTIILELFLNGIYKNIKQVISPMHQFYIGKRFLKIFKTVDVNNNSMQLFNCVIYDMDRVAMYVNYKKATAINKDGEEYECGKNDTLMIYMTNIPDLTFIN